MPNLNPDRKIGQRNALIKVLADVGFTHTQIEEEMEKYCEFGLKKAQIGVILKEYRVKG